MSEPHVDRSPSRLNLLVYNALLIVLFPLIGAFLLYRRAIGKEDASHWPERWGRLEGTGYREQVTGDKASHSPALQSRSDLRSPAERPQTPNSLGGPLTGEPTGGIATPDTQNPTFWLHAVSVGEVMAAVPVLRGLRARFPDAHIVLSTTTRSGREVALDRPEPDCVVYYPLDFAFCVARALDAIRPDVVILMEWELWPNFLAAAKKRGARVAVVNGRISDRGLRRARGGLSRFFLAPALFDVDRFLMQSDEDARRAKLVGAVPKRVQSVGNTKFDESVAMLSKDERAALRTELGIAPDAPVLVAGSTRVGKDGVPDEEVLIAQAATALRERFPELVMIVAPRHLERADTAMSHLPGAARRSRGEKVDRGGTLLLDTFGELGRVYSIADVAFVGGSLAPWGGQSVFQPLAQGVPAVFGPHMNNQRDIAALAASEGVGFLVGDADELATQTAELLALPPGERAALSQKARALIERNQGVAARCLETIAALLPPGGAGRADL